MMTLIHQYEQASIQEKLDAQAMKAALQQACLDEGLPTDSEAVLISRTMPLGKDTSHLQIQGPRWYVRVLHDGGPTLYRVWLLSEKWHAEQVGRTQA